MHLYFTIYLAHSSSKDSDSTAPLPVMSVKVCKEFWDTSPLQTFKALLYTYCRFGHVHLQRHFCLSLMFDHYLAKKNIYMYLGRRSEQISNQKNWKGGKKTVKE